MKKSILVVCVLFTAFVSLAFLSPQQIGYENLKVLPKDTNKYQMDSIMKHFESALGVNCNFCHVKNTDGMKDFDFASDKNRHKLVAREMLIMNQKINAEYFNGDGQPVTCYTCHGGKKHPETNVPKKDNLPWGK